MEARFNDFQQKKIELDLWASTGEDTVGNKIRYFENCLPANGETSMRKGAYWGTDPNRRTFIEKTKLQLRKENPSWIQELNKKKILWKKRHLHQIHEYLKYVDGFQKSNLQNTNLRKVKMVLSKQKERESITLKNLEEEALREKRIKERKCQNRLRRLENRRRKEKNRNEEKSTHDVLDFNDIYDINLDFDADEILKMPIIYSTSNYTTTDCLTSVGKNVPKDFLEIEKKEEDNEWKEELTSKDLTNSSGTETDVSTLVHFQERNRSPDDWFYPPSNYSEDSNFDPFCVINSQTDRCLSPEEESLKHESSMSASRVCHSSDLALEESSCSSRASSLPKDEIDPNIIVLSSSDEEEEREKHLSQIFLPCQSKTCCLRLTTAINVDKPIPCLQEHVAKMVINHSEKVR